VHAYRPTLAAAVAGRADTDLKILGVTILTSWDDHDVVDAGYSEPLTEMVRRRAIDTSEAGADGVIIAAREAPLVRAALGPDLLIVTPGIRPHGSAVGDQKRAVTPAEAIAAGVDHMVVGRPITAADDPAAAARAIQDEIAEALQML
jgi:orotidine-5'-phosphate decarboxylase